MTEDGKLPLKGIRVLDFGLMVAVSLANRVLADYGAEVLKVESATHQAQTGGSPLGLPGATRAGGGLSHYNHSKLGISINLAHPGVRELVLRLVPLCDVVTNNFSPGVLERHGLGYQVMRQVKPDIIALSAPMAGLTGPISNYRAMGIGIQHLAGVGYITGHPHQPPGPIPLSYPDYTTNPYHVATALLAALRYRRLTGKGQFIELSQYESTALFVGTALLDYSVNGRVAERSGNASRHYAPHNVYPCEGEDRWCAIAVTSEREWMDLCHTIDRPDLLKDSRFATVATRMLHREELDKELETWTRQRTAEEVMRVLQAAGVPAGVVETGEDMVERDPQHRLRGLHVKISHPQKGEGLHHTQAALLSRTPGRLRTLAPFVGENNEYVYRELLGMSEGEFREGEASGLIK